MDNIDGEVMWHFSTAHDSLLRAASPADLTEYTKSRGVVSVSFQETLVVPESGAGMSAEFRAAHDEAFLARYDELVRALTPQYRHQLGGYPVHYRTGELSPRGSWTSLIVLNSDRALGWWCDGEHLSGSMQRLIRPDFSRVKATRHRRRS